MMPPRIVPISSQTLTPGLTAVSTTTFPHGATLVIVADGGFRFAVSKEANLTNSMHCGGSDPIYTTVGASGYVSIVLDPTPIGTAATIVTITEVSIS